MRVVLDTNILARAASNRAGPAGQLLDRFQAFNHVLIVSPFMLRELERVLHYPGLRALHGLSDQRIIEFVDGIANVSSIVATPVHPPVVVVTDPDDNLSLQPPWRVTPMCCAPLIGTSAARSSQTTAVQ